MKRLIAAAIVLTLALAGCGSTQTKTVTVEGRGLANQQTLVPANRIAVPCEAEPLPHDAKPCIPQSAVRPDGYTPHAPPLLSIRPSSIHIDHVGLAFIEGFEGFGSCPYWDAYGGVWTRGYGETEGIHGGSSCISRSYGEANLKYRLERFYRWAIVGLGVNLNQYEADALYSFAWNLGAGIFTGSLRRSIQRHDPYPLLAYDHAGGVVLSGLARRRRAEVALFRRKPPPEETPAHRAARVHRERVARLHSDYRARRGLRSVIARYRCSGGYDHKRRDVKRKCTAWRTRGARVNRDIAALHRLGIR